MEKLVSERGCSASSLPYGSMLVSRSGLRTPGHIDERDFRIRRCDALSRVTSGAGLRKSEGTRSAAR